MFYFRKQIHTHRHILVELVYATPSDISKIFPSGSQTIRIILRRPALRTQLRAWQQSVSEKTGEATAGLATLGVEIPNGLCILMPFNGHWKVDLFNFRWHLTGVSKSIYEGEP